MTSVSYTTLLVDWFRVHIPIPPKLHSTRSPRTGYAAAYPKVQRCHRRPTNLLSCMPLLNKSKKGNKRSKSVRRSSTMNGCASFARFDGYQEGDSEDDC